MKAIHIAVARARTREREVRQIATHDERMVVCIVCREPRGAHARLQKPGGGASAFSTLICPDCYVCQNCGPKCDECSDIPPA